MRSKAAGERVGTHILQARIRSTRRTGPAELWGFLDYWMSKVVGPLILIGATVYFTVHLILFWLRQRSPV